MKTKTGRLTLFLGLSALAITLFLAATVRAETIIQTWEGTLAADKDFYATTAWTDATLSYSIQLSNTGVVHYSYTFSDVKSLSHIIIQVSDTFTAADFGNVVGTTEYELGTYTSSQGNSNPGLPNPIYGIKFDAGESTNPFTVSFDSNRLPMDGYFYIKDGKDSGVDVIAYNWPGEKTYRYLPVPDTQAPPPSGTPLPPSALLLGSGLLGLGLLGFRRKITT